jgi:hypothetical protein
VRTCTIEPQALTLAEQWLNQRLGEWEGRFDQLDAYLKTTQQGEGNGNSE